MHKPVYCTLASFIAMLTCSGLPAKEKPVWLIGTMSALADFERRALIRSTWQTLYNDTRYRFCFVLGKVDAAHETAIETEQAEYHDLLLLSSADDNPHAAKNIKPLEFFQHIALSGEYYDFVSTLDDDSFLNIPDFEREYLAPRLQKTIPEPCLIGRPLIAQSQVTGQNFMYPDSQFYTLSWDLMEVVARQYSLAPIKDAGEEALGRLLDRSQEPYSFVSLSNRQVFNYDPRRDDPHAWSHRVCKDAINPGGMKSDRTFLEVAKFFDKDGLKPEGKHC